MLPCRYNAFCQHLPPSSPVVETLSQLRLSLRCVPPPSGTFASQLRLGLNRWSVHCVWMLVLHAVFNPRCDMQKWQTAARLNKRSRQEEGGKDSMAFTALKQWASVPKKAREAMKRCPEIVESLELPIIEFLGKVRVLLQNHSLLSNHNSPWNSLPKKGLIGDVQLNLQSIRMWR